MKHYEKRRSVSGRLFVLMLALVLVLGCAVGGTVAWLVAKTEPVVNTFTYGDINITLTETKPANRQAKIIPGVDIEKDPKVTVKADSEACWLFVEVKEEGTFVANKVTYSVDDGWTKGDGTKIPENVYYRAVDAVTTDTDFAVLKDNKICVSEELTKSDIQSITTQPKLTFTAYAVQKDGMDTAAAAWAAANS
jgi:flagellar basal body-associated protein FliL